MVSENNLKKWHKEALNNVQGGDEGLYNLQKQVKELNLRIISLTNHIKELPQLERD